MPHRLRTEHLTVLEHCQQIFRHAEGFYLYLSDIHRDDREIARIWGLLAIDKCNHSDAFKMALRLKGEGISGITVSAEKSTYILGKMKAIPTGNRTNLPSVVDALRFALSMEDRLNSVHFRHAVRFSSEQDRDLMTLSLKSSEDIIQIMTEEYINLTMFE